MVNLQVSSLRIQRSLSRGPHSLDSAIRTLWLLNSQSLASQLTPTINSSLSLSVPLSFVLAHHARVPQPLVARVTQTFSAKLFDRRTNDTLGLSAPRLSRDIVYSSPDISQASRPRYYSTLKNMNWRESAR